MNVKVELSGVLSQVSCEKTAAVEASTLAEALERLASRYGGEFRERLFDNTGKPRRFINIYVNGKDCRFLKRLNTELREGDTISIIPAVSGG